MTDTQMKLNIRRLSQNKNLFEFTISTPALRSQFRLSRTMLNQLRALIEKALITP